MKLLTSKWTLLAILSAALVVLFLYRSGVEAARQMRLETRDRWVAGQLDSLRNGNSHVSLYSCENTDFMLQSMAGMSEIESIHIQQSDWSDAGLSYLSSLPNLHCLAFSGQPEMSDDSIAAIAKCLSLKKLQIFGPNRISDSGIVALAKVGTLELFEHSGQVTETAIQRLRSSSVNLKIEQADGW